MSRKKAVRVKKKKIKNQMENAAEETVTVETEETAEQEAAGQSPSAEEQKTAETAEPEKEIKEAGQAEEKKEVSGEAEKIEAEKTEESENAAVPAEEKKADSEFTEEEKTRQEEVYRRRFNRHFDELKWLYTEVYGNDSMFAELCDNLHRFYEERNQDLKASDLRREENPGWYKQNDMLGMMLYIDNFAGDIKGVESRLDYLEKSNVNYIHLMPFWRLRRAGRTADTRFRISGRYRKSWGLWKTWKALPPHAAKRT